MLTQDVVLLRVEKWSQRWLRRWADWNTVDVLAGLFALAARERLELLEERVEVALPSQYALASSHVALQLFGTEALQKCHDFLLEISLLRRKLFPLAIVGCNWITKLNSLDSFCWHEILWLSPRSRCRYPARPPNSLPLRHHFHFVPISCNRRASRHNYVSPRSPRVHLRCLHSSWIPAPRLHPNTRCRFHDLEEIQVRKENVELRLKISQKLLKRRFWKIN